MSKRVIEFNCGDPKSNQQTASKVDCQITINNTNSNPNASTETQRRKSKNVSRDIKLTGGIEVFNSEDNLTDDIDAQSTTDRSSVMSDKDFETKVNVPVNVRKRSLPTSAERFVMVSRQPIITTEEIENNIEFHKKRAEILTNALCMDDKKLLANLIDNTGKVIISAQEFCELVSIMLSNDDYQVNASDIAITFQEELITSCFKVHVTPYKRITAIKINNQDFHNVQNEAYNALSDKYKISVEQVYVVPFSSAT